MVTGVSEAPVAAVWRSRAVVALGLGLRTEETVVTNSEVRSALRAVQSVCASTEEVLLDQPVVIPGRVRDDRGSDWVYTSKSVVPDHYIVATLRLNVISVAFRSGFPSGQVGIFHRGALAHLQGVLAVVDVDPLGSKVAPSNSSASAVDAVDLAVLNDQRTRPHVNAVETSISRSDELAVPDDDVRCFDG